MIYRKLYVLIKDHLPIEKTSKSHKKTSCDQNVKIKELTFHQFSKYKIELNDKKKKENRNHLKLKAEWCIIVNRKIHSKEQNGREKEIDFW